MNYFYTNLLNDRAFALSYVARKSAKYGKTTLRNGRSFARLSTRQLVAKAMQLDTAYSARVGKYVASLDRISRSVEAGLSPALQGAN